VSGRDFLQIRDAARMLGVTEKTLRNWDRAGHLRAHRHPINGYRLYHISDLHGLLGRLAELPEAPRPGPEQLALDLLGSDTPTQHTRTEEELAPCHWTRAVAMDPKHRPQKWDHPSSTVRRDWRKFPQEAHVLDSKERRYRRFTAEEIALLQGFEPQLIQLPELTERERIGALGDAVPPPLARRLVTAITSVWSWTNRTSLEICAGAGGLAEGAAACELEHLLLIDASPTCAKLLMHNRRWPKSIVAQGDIRKHDFSKLRDRVGLLSGGPPCQPWSQSGLHGGDQDERDLLGSMPELIVQLRPEVFLFENVPGLAMFDEGVYLRQLIERLRRPNPHLQYGVLAAMFNAADFGVPQIRNRIFIIGFREAPGLVANRCFDEMGKLMSHRDPATANGTVPVWRTIGDALTGRDDPGGWRRWIGSNA